MPTGRDFPEPDWKVLRVLAEVALERFCQRVLEEATPLVAGPKSPSTSYHERYLALYKLLHQRDKQLGNAFNALKRSTALLQLVNMRRLQLVTDEEFATFTQDTQDSVQEILEITKT